MATRVCPSARPSWLRYIDQERQEALLDLEGGLLQYWPRANAGAGAVGGVTAGQALSTVLGERLRRAQLWVQMQDDEGVDV